jgi:dihydroorotate dehydrogenase (fumarate)
VFLNDLKIKYMADLKTKYLGLELKNPLIVASSGLTDSLQNIVSLEKAGAGAIVLKSIFEEEIVSEMETKMKQMATESFLYPETLDFYEDMEEENISLKYLELIREAKSKLNIPIIASINCVTADYWTLFPKQIEIAGADALELNIFVLPSDFRTNRKNGEQLYFDIIQEVTSKVKIPVSVKLSYYFSDLASTLLKLSQTSISGLVLFNKFYNPDFDIDKLEVTSGKILSSSDDYHNTLRWISIMGGRTSCSLAASTGIHNGETAVKMLLAGADALQIASVIYQTGQDQIHEILSFIADWMDKKGFDNISDFRGKMSQALSNNPAAYERVQFMKYFRGYKG